LLTSTRDNNSMRPSGTTRASTTSYFMAEL
jgi:hypothetical protein